MKPIYYITLFIFLFSSLIAQAQTLEPEDIIIESTTVYPDASYNPSINNTNDFGIDRDIIGDIDGDGINDMGVVGTINIGTSQQPNIKGVFYILFLNADGTVNRHIEFSESIFGYLPNIYTTNSSILTAVAGLGDIDNNGVPDVVLGFGNAREGIWQGTHDIASSKHHGGITTVLLDRDANGVVSVSSYNTYYGHDIYDIYERDNPNSNHSPSDFPRTGLRVENIGDIDNDQVTDIAISSAGDRLIGDGRGWPVRGRVYIARLNSNGSLKSAQLNYGGINPNIVEYMFGQRIAALGYFGSKKAIAISEHYATIEGVEKRGAVHIYSVNSDGSYTKLSTISHDPSKGINLQANEWFGLGVAAIGDIDCDGNTDIAVTNYFGRIHIIMLNVDGSVKHYQKIEPTTTSYYDVYPNNIAPYWGLDNGIDEDGDGLNEILVQQFGGTFQKIKFRRHSQSICAEPCETTATTTLTFPSYQLNEVINTSAQTLSDNWMLSKYTPFKVNGSIDLPEISSRPYVVGKQGIWRGESSFAYVTDRKQSAPIDLSKDGTYTLNMFNWKYLGELDCPEWRKVETVSEYHPQSSDIERYNILKLYSSFHIGYSDQLVSAAAANSKQYEFGFEGFEEYTDEIYYANANLLFSTYEDRREIPIPYWFTLETGRNRRIWAPLELQTLQNQYNFDKLHILGKRIDVNYPGEFRSHTTFEEITLDTDKSLIKFSLNEPTPFEGFWTGKVGVTIDKMTSQTFNGGQPKVANGIAHTGTKSLKIELPASFNQPYLLLIPNKKYVISAWVRIDDENKPIRIASYQDYANLQVELGDGTFIEFKPEGQIIEGWQRIEGSFTVPNEGMGEWNIHLVNNKGLATYFDDIRLFPSLGNMESFVYDTETFRLEAKLDANNYATFYYYDAEGRLYLVKQETARGVQTLQTVTTHTKRD